MKNFKIENFNNFDNHRLIIFLNSSISKLKGFIVIHRGGIINPSFGATRFIYYKNEIEALKDALKLSRAMTYKSVMAGFNYGGAKGVLINNSLSAKEAVEVMKEFGKRINYLHGFFITGQDMGISKKYLKAMASRTKFVVGFKVDPVKYTALGLCLALKECLKIIFNNDKIENKTFVIQGLGNVGLNFLKLIYKKKPIVFVSDINPDVLKKIKKKFKNVNIVSPLKVYSIKSDVFVPCVQGGVLNKKTVNKLNTKIIIGGANNQLSDEYVGEILFKKGILYAPDYVVNAGGLISVIYEYKNKKDNYGEIFKKLTIIPRNLRKIIELSKIKNRATNLIANELIKMKIDKIK